MCTKKGDPGDGKPIFISSLTAEICMYGTECIKLINTKNLPCTTTSLQWLCLSKISHFQNLHICRLDLMRISPSCKT